MHYRVLLRVADQRVLLLPVLEPLRVIGDPPGEPVEPSRPYLAVFTNYDAADLSRWILAPLGDVLCEVDEALVPLVTHIVPARMQGNHTSVRPLRSYKQVRALAWSLWVLSGPEGSVSMKF